MSERLAVDSLMTADGEVVQLPTLGPLGPVDAEGGRIPLDTVRLFDAEGRFLKVESYEFSTWSQRWVVHLGSGRDAYADDCYSGFGPRAPGARAWTGRRAAGDVGADRGDGAEGACAGTRPGPRAQEVEEG